MSPFDLLKSTLAELFAAVAAQQFNCSAILPCLIKDLFVFGFCSEIGVWVWSVPNLGSRREHTVPGFLQKVISGVHCGVLCSVPTSLCLTKKIVLKF